MFFRVNIFLDLISFYIEYFLGVNIFSGVLLIEYVRKYKSCKKFGLSGSVGGE